MHIATATRKWMVILLLWSFPMPGGGGAASAMEDIAVRESPAAVRKVTLPECYRIAKENSVTIRNAKLDLEIAALKAKNARVAYWPSLSAGVGYAVDDQTRDFSNSDRYEIYLSLTRALSYSNEIFSILKEALNSAVSAELGLHQNERKLLAEVAQRFFDLIAAQKQLDLESVMNRQSRRNFTEAQKKFAQGSASALEVLQTEADYRTRELNLLSKTNAVEDAALMLSAAIGISPAKNLRAVGRASTDFYRVAWERCLAIALENNQELKIYRKTLDQLKKLHRLAKRANWPVFSVDGFVGGSPDDLYDEEANYGIRLSLTKTIYDWGVVGRRIEEYEIEIRKQEDLVQDVEKKFVDLLKLEYDQLSHSLSELTLAKQRRDIAVRLAELMQRSYTLGAISLKEKLDSNTGAENAQFEHTRALQKAIVTETRLKLRMGIDPFAGDEETAVHNQPSTVTD